ncbi:hypothetical protein ES20_04640 [Rothia aeria]|nr:hypothetical protein ES20_04640 [Rothia aeria]KGJ34959.1 hypothetical protein ES18_02495 [Rothia aeria]
MKAILIFRPTILVISPTTESYAFEVGTSDEQPRHYCECLRQYKDNKPMDPEQIKKHILETINMSFLIP